jgi:hypothetical protein
MTPHLQHAFATLRKVASDGLEARLGKSPHKIMGSYLKKVAGDMTAPGDQVIVTALRADIMGGVPLAYAIKRAFPEASGEQRGIIASRMVNDSLKHFRKRAAKKAAKKAAAKAAEMGATATPGAGGGAVGAGMAGGMGGAAMPPMAGAIPVTGPQSFTGAPGAAGAMMR